MFNLFYKQQKMKLEQPRDSKGRFKSKKLVNLKEFYNKAISYCQEEGKYEKAFNKQFYVGDLSGLTISSGTIVPTPQIKIELQKTTYKLSQGDFLITAIIRDNDKITIKNGNDQKNFHFENSSPKTIKAIGELLIEASKLNINAST